MKVLIIRPGALGDTLLMLPALVELRGKATVYFAGREPGLGFLRDAVHRAMDLERAGWHRLFLEQTFVVGPSPLPVSRANKVLAFFKDSEGIIGKNLEVFFPDAEIFVFPAFPPKLKKIHVARYLARCLESAGLPLNSNGAMDNARKSPLLSGAWVSKEKDRLVFHPGSGDHAKNHSADFWRHILRIFSKNEALAHLNPTLLLGPAETALKPIFESAEQIQRGMEILFCPEKETLLKVLGAAAIYLGHDSGITHLSGLMGIPTLALFKQTDPVQWGPLGPHVRIIRPSKPGRVLLDRLRAAVHSMVTADG